MSQSLKERFGAAFAEMTKLSKAAAKIDETKVYEEANMALRKYMNVLLDEAFNSESGLGNIENFKAFYNAVANEGKSGLILMEHYTNIDLPGITDEISFTTGTRVKRVTDSSKTKTADGTKLDASEMKDDLGWVAIAKYVEGGSAPTAIEEIEVVETAGSPIVPYVINNIIYVENVDDFEVHSITGAKVAAHATQAPGIYVVTAGKYSAKVIVK